MLTRLLTRLYARVFSRGKLAVFNRALLGLALHAQGYHNYRSSQSSGEAFFIEKILAKTEPRLCIDIGANRGEYTQQLLQNTSAVVHAIEPHPLSFQELVPLKQSFGKRLALHNFAIGSKRGTADLHFTEGALYFASLSTEASEVPYVKNQEKTEVRVITLDDFCSSNGFDHVDLVKIDVEGFENEVMKGAQNVLKNIRPAFVQVEFNWHQLFRDTSIWSLSKYLPGYRPFQLLPGGWAERDPKDPFSNVYKYSNFVFVRE